jgi:hypothetical protein
LCSVDRYAKFRSANFDQVSRFEPLQSRDWNAIQNSAIGRVKVLEDNALLLEQKLAMPRGDLVIIFQFEITLWRATEHRSFRQVNSVNMTRGVSSHNR